MATHSSILTWKTPWMEKSDGLPSMELQSQTQLSDFTLIPLQIKRISPESGLTFVAGDSCTLGVFWCNESWSSLVSPFQYSSRSECQSLTIPRSLNVVLLSLCNFVLLTLVNTGTGTQHQSAMLWVQKLSTEKLNRKEQYPPHHVSPQRNVYVRNNYKQAYHSVK